MNEENCDKKFLKTLQEHNLDVTRRHNKQENLLNGIACPLCGEELFDSSPGMLLMSSPAQTYVKCSKCLYEGTRLV